MNNTPLRYPGGKSIMTPLFEQILTVNESRTHHTYAEPYAGGAGTALNLLLSDRIEFISINDAAIGIYSFWNALVNDGDRFVEKIQETPVNLTEWRLQRAIFKSARIPSFELGFATFYLSRTNRSGILSAGPIGGQDERMQENANYKIDCRFNKADLIARVRRIVESRHRISVSNLDALDFLRNIEDEHTLVYLDPPYYDQGEALYLNYYRHEDHLKLANFLRWRAKFDWVLSYDNVPAILDLYADFPLYQYGLSYTAQNVKQGSELITHSSGVIFPCQLNIKKKKGYISFMGIV
jgi:DNA adenine methylase